MRPVTCSFPGFGATPWPTEIGDLAVLAASVRRGGVLRVRYDNGQRCTFKRAAPFRPGWPDPNGNITHTHTCGAPLTGGIVLIPRAARHAAMRHGWLVSGTGDLLVASR